MTGVSGVIDPRFSQPFPERLAFQQFHGDKRLAFVFVDVMNGADVGVIESRRRLSFALKPLQRLTVFDEPLGQELQRDEAMELGVLGLIDHAHPAATELFQNAVVGNSFANHDPRQLWVRYTCERFYPILAASGTPARP